MRRVGRAGGGWGGGGCGKGGAFKVLLPTLQCTYTTSWPNIAGRDYSSYICFTPRARQMFSLHNARVVLKTKPWPVILGVRSTKILVRKSHDNLDVIVFEKDQ